MSALFDPYQLGIIYLVRTQNVPKNISYPLIRTLTCFVQLDYSNCLLRLIKSFLICLEALNEFLTKELKGCQTCQCTDY